MEDTQPNDHFWQSLPVRIDRSPNELNDIGQLVQALTDPYHPMNLSTPTFFTTEFGNINGDGNPTSFSSPVLGMRNAHLNIALEPRIAPLVNLIKDLGFATYSSCEGHLIQGTFYEAYVGFLYSEADKVNANTLLPCAKDSGFLVFRTWLIDSFDGNGYKTVEIYFPRANCMDLDDYHEALRRGICRLASSFPPHEHRTHKPQI